MPRVTTDRNRLTTQIRKYSPLRPVKSKRYVVSAAVPWSFTRLPRMASGHCTGLMQADAAEGCARFSLHALSFQFKTAAISMTAKEQWAFPRELQPRAG